MKTRMSCEELVRGSVDRMTEWVEERIGHEFKPKYSLDYPHGKIVSGKVKSVHSFSNWYDVIWEATFTDGYKADYATSIDGFILSHFYDF